MGSELTREQKRFIVLAVIAGVVILFLIYSGLLTPSQREISAPQVKSNLTLGEEEVVSEEVVLDTQKPIRLGGGKKMVLGRDPFRLPPGVKLGPGRKETTQGPESTVERVTAILITDSRKVASINHQVVTIGDWIDGEQVMDIKPDRVVLGKNRRNRELILQQSPISMDIRDRRTP